MDDEKQVRRCIHDLRNELNNMLMQAELLRMKSSDGEAGPPKVIVSHGRRAGRILEELAGALGLTD